MVDPQVIREWLKKADEDFDFAVSVIDDTIFYAQVCFHFHQSAEKYLKSFMIANDLEFKKIHDLPVLLRDCTNKMLNFNTIIDDCKFLNRFYIDTRYPVHWPSEYTKQEAFRAKDAAGHIRDVIKEALESLGVS